MEPSASSSRSHADSGGAKVRFLHHVRRVPWATWDEWMFVRSQLAMFLEGTWNSPGNVEAAAAQGLHALARIAAWRARGNLPLAVDLTAALVEGCIKDERASRMDVFGVGGYFRSQYESRLLLGMALLRLVNGVADAGQRGTTAWSIHQLAARARLPRILVDVRHEGTHNTLPSLPVLRVAAGRALSWLRDRYWHAQATAADFTPFREKLEAEIARYRAARAFWEDVKEWNGLGVPKALMPARTGRLDKQARKRVRKRGRQCYMTDSRFEAPVHGRGCVVPDGYYTAMERRQAAELKRAASRFAEQVARSAAASGRTPNPGPGPDAHQHHSSMLLRVPSSDGREHKSKGGKSTQPDDVPGASSVARSCVAACGAIAQASHTDAGVGAAFLVNVLVPALVSQMIPLDNELERFPVNHLGVHRLQCRWGPLLVRLATRWPLFTAAAAIHLVDIVCQEAAFAESVGEDGDDALVGAGEPQRGVPVAGRTRIYFVLAWLRFFVSRDWMSIQDPGLSRMAASAARKRRMAASTPRKRQRVGRRGRNRAGASAADEAGGLPASSSPPPASGSGAGAASSTDVAPGVALRLLDKWDAGEANFMASRAPAGALATAHVPVAMLLARLNRTWHQATALARQLLAEPRHAEAHEAQVAQGVDLTIVLNPGTPVGEPQAADTDAPARGATDQAATHSVAATDAGTELDAPQARAQTLSLEQMELLLFSGGHAGGAAAGAPADPATCASGAAEAAAGGGAAAGAGAASGDAVDAGGHDDDNGGAGGPSSDMNAGAEPFVGGVGSGGSGADGRLDGWAPSSWRAPCLGQLPTGYVPNLELPVELDVAATGVYNNVSRDCVVVSRHSSRSVALCCTLDFRQFHRGAGRRSPRRRCD